MALTKEQQRLRNCERQLRAYQKEHSAGNRAALARVIDACAYYQVPLPSWAASAFRYGFREIAAGTLKSWELVLGKPNAENRKLAAIARRKKRDLEIFHAVKMHRRKRGDKESRFHAIGRELGLAESTCRKRYYAFKNFYLGDANELHPKDSPKSKKIRGKIS